MQRQYRAGAARLHVDGRGELLDSLIKLHYMFKTCDGVVVRASAMQSVDLGVGIHFPYRFILKNLQMIFTDLLLGPQHKE